MSRWGNWGNYWSGHFPSPFARNTTANGAGESTLDDAISYITTEDLKRNAIERSHGDDDEDSEYGQRHRHRASSGGTRVNELPTPTKREPHNTDLLVLKHRKESHNIHFPAQSIDRGELHIGDIRAAAAKRANTSPGNVQLFYKGRNLKDDRAVARDEGLRSDRVGELLCIVGERPPRVPNSDDDESDEEGEDIGMDQGAQKKKKRKNKKKKSRKSDGLSPTPSNGYVGAQPNTSTFLPPSSIPSPVPRASAAPPPPKAVPSGPLEQIAELRAKFNQTFTPLCTKFIDSPPKDKKTRDFEHRKLSETIMMQILEKLDAVEAGDHDRDEVRKKRKECIVEVQDWLGRLDEAAGQA